MTDDRKPGVLGFILANQTDAGGVLTPEVLDKAIADIYRRDAWEREHPHGLDPENGHVTDPQTAERLKREGGYGMCSICGPFYVPKPQ